jgi:hypothetical protein
VLALTLENGTYNIKVNRLSGPTTYSSQLVTGTLWTVPNDPSPVQSVEATVATFVTDFTGGTLPAGVTLTRASSGSYVSGSAVGTLLSVTDLVTTSTGAGVGVTTLPVPGITASVGDMLLMACAADNAGAAGTSSTNAPITDPTGNVWARQSMVNRTTAGVSNDGTTLSIWSCLLTAPMVNNSVSIGFSTNSRASAGVKRIVGSGLAVESVGPGLTGTGGTPAQSVGPIEIVSNRAMFGWTARESNAPLGTGDTDTLGGPWSAPQNSTADTGTSGTSQTLGGQHKIPTFSSLQTFDTSGAGDYAMNYVIVSGTAVGARQLMIAGANFPRFTYDPATGVLQGLLNEPTEVNSIANGAFIGSTVGIPGTVLNSTQTGTLAPLVREVTAIGVEDGLPYVEIRISGTTSSTVSNNHGLQVVLNSLSLPTIPLVGQTWTGSIYTRLVAGSLNNLDLQFNLQERNSGTPLVTNTLSISPTNAPLITQRRTLTATLIDPTVNVLRASIFFYQPFGFSLPIDFTIRVSGLTNALSNQLTSLILTSTNLGTVGVTRATDVLTIPIPSGLYIATVERLNGTQVYYNNPVAPGAGFVVPTSGSPLRKVTLEVAPVYTGVKATPVVIVAGGQPVYAGPVTPRVMVTSGAVYDGPATPIQIVTGRDTLIGPATPMMEVVGRPVLPGPAIPVR